MPDLNFGLISTLIPALVPPAYISTHYYNAIIANIYIHNVQSK